MTYSRTMKMQSSENQVELLWNYSGYFQNLPNASPKLVIDLTVEARIHVHDTHRHMHQGGHGASNIGKLLGCNQYGSCTWSFRTMQDCSSKCRKGSFRTQESWTTIQKPNLPPPVVMASLRGHYKLVHAEPCCMAKRSCSAPNECPSLWSLDVLLMVDR